MIKEEMLEEPITITSFSDNDTHWFISTNHSGFGIEKKYNYTPQVGDVVELYVYGGSAIRGAKINGVELYYKSDEELEADRLAWLEKYAKEKQERFEREKDSLDADYESLPEIFKTRIDGFRNEDPNFRVDAEAYEMFCIKEALKIAEYAKTPEEVERYKSLTYDEQISLVNISDGHSNNTFSGACGLAYWFLKDPTKLIKSEEDNETGREN